MKSTGIVRKVDEVGRIVLPMGLRQCFDINTKDKLEIFTEGEKILLKKYEPSCIFCDEVNNIVSYKEKRICKKCIKNMLEIK